MKYWPGFIVIWGAFFSCFWQICSSSPIARQVWAWCMGTAERAIVLGPPELMKIACVGHRQTCCSQHVVCEGVCVFVLVERYRKLGGTSYVSLFVLHMRMCCCTSVCMETLSRKNTSPKFENVGCVLCTLLRTFKERVESFAKSGWCFRKCTSINWDIFLEWKKEW